MLIGKSDKTFLHGNNLFQKYSAFRAKTIVDGVYAFYFMFNTMDG